MCRRHCPDPHSGPKLLAALAELPFGDLAYSRSQSLPPGSSCPITAMVSKAPPPCLGLVQFCRPSQLRGSLRPLLGLSDCSPSPSACAMLLPLQVWILRHSWVTFLKSSSQGPCPKKIYEARSLSSFRFFSVLLFFSFPFLKIFKIFIYLFGCTEP